MKKIVFITNLDVLGGTENNLVSIAAHPGFMNSFTSWIFSGTPPHPALVSRLKKSTARVVQHNTYLGIRAPKIFRDRLFKIQIQKIKPDVVVFWNHAAKSGQLHICRKLGIRTIFFERGTGWRRHNGADMNRFLSSVDQVLSNSTAGRRVLEKQWGYKGPCQVLPNALRPEISTENSKPKKFPDGRPVRIGIAARLVAYKGVASAVLAMNELQKKGLSAELHIAGSGVEKEKLQALADRLDISAFFHGTVENMRAFYQSIEILVIPSIREPFGTVAIEAQASGCPILGSGVDGLPEVVLHGRTGFVITPSWDIDKYLQYTAEKGNMPYRVFFPHLNELAPPLALHPEHIALKAAQLLKDEKLFSEMSRNAVQFITENFQFDEYIKKINSAFKGPE